MSADCEHCAYYAYDEECGEYVCDAAFVIDEDEAARMHMQEKQQCPFFRFYDEYKLVQKQN